MSKMIQLRNVPDHVHRILKRRALEEGTTLSELLIREVTALANRPTIDDLFARIASRGAAQVKTSTAAAVRAERDAQA